MGNGTVQHESCNSSGLFCRTARGFAELQLEGTRRRNRAQQRCLLPTPMHPTPAATRRTGVATIPHASPGTYPQIHGLRAGFPKRYGVAPAADASDCPRRFPTFQKSGNRNLLRVPSRKTSVRARAPSTRARTSGACAGSFVPTRALPGGGLRAHTCPSSAALPHRERNLRGLRE